MLHALIMAGGSGTRFWPLSRQRLPKQFLKLHGERSLIQQAHDRIAGLVGEERLLILTNQVQVPKTREQLPELPSGAVIGEPCGRDTAPCIALGAALIAKSDPDANMVVLAADHLIEPPERFHDAIETANKFVDDDPQTLVTFGIPPTFPSTGYGYLQRDEPLASGDINVFQLKSFHEKPDAETAKSFVDSGTYYWNSGIFCWRASTILSEIRRCAPEIGDGIDRIVAAWDSDECEKVFAAEFEALPKISIDYAVMEKAPKVAMVEVPFQWDDVGSWGALERVNEINDEGNVVLGRHVGLDTSGCIIVGDEDHVVSTIGVRDLIIVQTPDGTLVADKAHEQDVKRLLEQLKERGLNQYL
ncbi:Mannose-1-phosphate guanylyltransferase [Planctomycetes bacterium Pan216]|uniref:mannose-1-phosphate guanylyltransferase n=1 Tax=Kolteria novifilia TaxID=2527975 RepID=A0A518BD13_9BACT|nr:Mannose-1-phosphate guanylyltransferase [Planctomycetes bacterium Pan216]